MKRFILTMSMWWVIALAGATLAVLLDRGTGMPGPLLPGQERPTYSAMHQVINAVTAPFYR